MKKISLTQGKFALVDPKDFEWAKQYKWYAQTSRYKGEIAYYAARREPRRLGHKILLLHRGIANANPEEDVDHWNGDTLDCRRDNLRIATRQQNCFNAQKRRLGTASSPYKGVCYSPRRTKPWRAYIGGTGVRSKTPQKHLGYFLSEVAAARAYNHAAVKLYGNFARLNLI